MLLQTIEAVRKQLQNGSLDAAELYRACLRRTELIKDLNAFVSIQKEFRPHKWSKQNPSRLNNIPIAIKDNFCTKGIPTTCGSRMLKDFVPPYNATVVEKLFNQGAVIIGKCNLDEFAMGSGTVDSIHGPTKNIWRSNIAYSVNNQEVKLPVDWRIAGGSSGGSAVAVATGTCFAALGSDTGGSARNPAAHCGIVGFKPTYSTVSRHGLVPLVNSMDVPSILARTVSDATTVYGVICGRDPFDSTTVDIDITPEKPYPIDPSQIRIGIPMEYHPSGLSEEVLAAWEMVASIFEKAGSSVKKISLPHTKYSISCYSVLNQAEVASNMARYDGLKYGYRPNEGTSVESLYAEARATALGQVVKARILAGNYFLLQRNYKKYFEKALKVRRLIVNDFLEVWKSVDILITPTTLTEAPSLSEFCKLDNRQQCSSEDYCTQPCNLAGCPAISVPVRLSANGLPIGIQLIAPNYKDFFLLAVSNWLEKNVSFPKLDLIDTETIK
ncbi:unnamed protein product [Nezara viridula]|uniref:Glutamyl-tRNA(Gln) amidotransferase subunit A, mitochondrial n=1 Tax=Nezara viridula TaxID=85310 RepID=A0A9P0MRT0_NEZVI|nr:unnamed protein product [Nezara viridula]